MFLLFLQGVALALPSTVVPSPLKIFLISQALQNGWRRVLPAALVPLVTDGPIIILVLFLLVQTPTWFLVTLQILGGFFILYLAARILTILKAETPALRASPEATRQSFVRAIGINFLNPNPYLLWGVVAGPTVLQAMEQSVSIGLSFIVGFYITFICGLAGLIFAFGTAGKLNPTLNKIISAVAAVALVIFGVYQIVTGVMKFSG